MPTAGIITLVLALLLLPLALAMDLLKLWRRWRLVPLEQKNMTRATCGAFALALCAALAASGFPYLGAKITGCIAAVALLYLGVGILGARGARFDWMSAFWWGVLAAGAAVLLGFVKLNGFPL
jgi:hypothetical protein